MKIVILCGGRGTRLREKTTVQPKPLVEIGNRPILWHIMKIYAHYGFKDFILCLGYKGDIIKQYFLNYIALSSDFTIRLDACSNIEFHNNNEKKDWKVTLVDTGEEAETGARIKRVEKYIDGDLFMVTYGDGLADINIVDLLKFHKLHGRIGTVTGVHPASRFGELEMEDTQIIEFNEKPQVKQGLINGGFFVFDRRFLNYLTKDNDCFMEGKPLKRLSSERELMGYIHNGFWQCVDTCRELELLNNLWKKPNPPWKIW